MADFLALLQAAPNADAGLTPVCPFTMSNDFSAFLDGNNLTYDVEAGASWLLMDAVSRVVANAVPRIPGGPQNLTCALAPEAGAAPGGAGGAAPAVHYLAANTPAERLLAQGIPRGAFVALQGDRDKSLYWLLNLTACHQIKPLRAANISNWLRMTSKVTMSGRSIVRIIDHASVTVPNIMDNAPLRALLHDDQFMTYHTAYSSTASLATEMLGVCPDVTNWMFSTESRNAVIASFANKTSRQLNGLISQQLVLATYAYLVTFSKLPDAWYQGEKAVSSLPANRLVLYKAIFKRIKDLTSNTEQIGEAADIAALIATIGENAHNL